MTRSELREFVDVQVTRVASAADEALSLPSELLAACSRAGLWGWNLPRAYGGFERSLLECGWLHEETGRSCSSLRALLTVHGMVGSAIARWGSSEQKTEWLPRMARGEALAAFALSEAEVGSDVSAVQMTAEPDARVGYRLKGTKKWITGGSIASVFLVFARRGEGIAAFLVPGDAPGLRRTPVQGMLGLRAAMLAEVLFDDVLVGETALLGPRNNGIAHVALRALQFGRLMVAFGCVGMAKSCLHAALTHAQERRQFGAPLAEQQLIQRRLAHMAMGIRSSELLCRSAAELEMAGDAASMLEILTAKYEAARIAIETAASAVQVMGASGCAPGSTVARFFRDAKVMEIVEGTTEILELKIAEQAAFAI